MDQNKKTKVYGNNLIQCLGLRIYMHCHIGTCSCHHRNIYRQMINKMDGVLRLQHSTKLTITIA